MTIHIAGTGWHGIKIQIVDHSHGGGISHETVEEVLPAWVTAALEPCPTCEDVCIRLHDAYEEAAVLEGWETQQASRKPWADVPETNKRTMRAAVRAIREHECCHEGRPTIIVTVPCCANQATCRDFSRPHCAWRTDGTADGRVERQAVIREALPVRGDLLADWLDRFVCAEESTVLLVDGDTVTPIDFPDAANYIGHYAAYFQVREDTP
jgi:hypothetical protein